MDAPRYLRSTVVLLQEEHEACGGLGCEACNDTGRVAEQCSLHDLAVLLALDRVSPVEPSPGIGGHDNGGNGACAAASPDIARTGATAA